jgi:hypothetical protein
MTEGDWLAAADPNPLLKHVQGTAGERRLRLFACACARHLGAMLLDYTEDREAIDVAERFADGQATSDDLMRARGRSRRVGAHWLANTSAWRAAEQWASCTSFRVSNLRAAQADLVREIFGNPFQPAAVEPAWLRWGDGTVGKMAQAIYEEQRFADLPILADALEDAGCACEPIVAHCRAAGPHVRGCWVVDLLLAKA